MTEKICSVCKEQFLCQASDSDCWCFDYKALEKVDTSSNSCFCPICLKNLLDKQNKK